MDYATIFDNVLRVVMGFLVAMGVVMVSAVVFPFSMRRLWGFMGDRLGPNRVGPQGFFQPIADGLKLFVKEDITPSQANWLLFLLAPAIAFITPTLMQVVIPFGEHYTIADLNIGLIYVIAVGSFGVTGLLLGGWASNNKYSLIGGLRSAAQMISYEIPLIITIIIVAVMTGSLSLNAVVGAQSTVWFAAVQPLAFLIYIIAGLAEMNRTPFDLPEAESELVSGYMTEYGGMRFAFYAAFIEWANAAAWAMVGSTLFLGGWRGPFGGSPAWLGLKVMFLVFVIIWFFATFPRLQVDQLMSFAWKVLIPLSLFNLLITGFFLLAMPDNAYYVIAGISWTSVVLFVVLMPRFLKGSVLKKRLQAMKEM